MVATDLQVQNFVDQRIRPRMEQIRALLVDLQDDKAAIDDVYAALTQDTPTWTDARTDGPPHLLTPGDIININSLITNLITAISGDAQYPVALKACVRSIGA